jgi:hypothetical protein
LQSVSFVARLAQGFATAGKAVVGLIDGIVAVGRVTLTVQEAFVSINDTLVGWIPGIGAMTQAAKDAVATGRESLDAWSQVSPALKEGFGAAADAAGNLADAADKAKTTLDGVAPSSSVAGEVLRREFTASQGVISSVKTDLQTVVSLLTGMGDVEIAADQALLSLASAAAAARAAIDGSKTVTDDERGALLGLASQALATRDALLSAGRGTNEVTAASQRAREQFIATAVRMGIAGKEAAKLADKYGLISGKKLAAQIELTGYEAAKNRIDVLNAAKLKPKVLTIYQVSQKWKENPLVVNPRTTGTESPQINVRVNDSRFMDLVDVEIDNVGARRNITAQRWGSYA